MSAVEDDERVPTPPPGNTPAEDEVSCALCGTKIVGPPMTWMFEVDSRRGGLWYCDHCVRQNLRSVEAKLDQEWW